MGTCDQAMQTQMWRLLVPYNILCRLCSCKRYESYLKGQDRQLTGAPAAGAKGNSTHLLCTTLPNKHCTWHYAFDLCGPPIMLTSDGQADICLCCKCRIKTQCYTFSRFQGRFLYLLRSCYCYSLWLNWQTAMEGYHALVHIGKKHLLNDIVRGQPLPMRTRQLRMRLIPSRAKCSVA